MSPRPPSGLSVAGLALAAVLGVGLALGIQRWIRGPVVDPPPPAALPSVDQDALIRFYKTQIARDPLDPRPLALLGTAYLEKARETGDESYHSLADAAGRESLRLREAPASGARPVLARVALARHDFAAAIELARVAHAGRPDDAEPAAIIFDAHLARGDVAEVESAAKALATFGPTQPTLARLAQLDLLRGRADEALSRLEAACRADDPRSRESSAWVRALLGSVHASRGRVARARVAYGEALALLPRHYLATTGLAELELREGHLDAAAALYEALSAGERGPTPETLAARARLEERRGQATTAAELRDRAEVAFRRVAATGLAGHRAPFARFLLARGRPADLTEALEIMKREAASRRDPETLEALGWAELANGHKDQARAAFAEALAPGYRTAWLLYRAGEAELALGDRAKGLAFFREALEVDAKFDERAAERAGEELRRKP